MAKPEWWNDEGLTALSAMIERAAPDEIAANRMRAMVLRGQCGAWETGAPRSAAELMEAATHYERAAAATLSAPAMKAHMANFADACRRSAEALYY